MGWKGSRESERCPGGWWVDPEVWGHGTGGARGCPLYSRRARSSPPRSTRRSFTTARGPSYPFTVSTGTLREAERRVTTHTCSGTFIGTLPPPLPWTGPRTRLLSSTSQDRDPRPRRLTVKGFPSGLRSSDPVATTPGTTVRADGRKHESCIPRGVIRPDRGL